MTFQEILRTKKGVDDMKEVESLKELRQEYRKIHSVATDTDRWLCKAFMFLIERGIHSVATDTDRWLCKAFMFLIERGTFGPLRPSKENGHRISEWQRFFGEGMKAGKSPSQIAKEWKSK